MKTKDVEVMNEVLKCLRDKEPISQELYDAFAIAVSNCNLALEKQRLRYRENTPRYRQATREWVQNNPERARKYQQDYQKRKKKRKGA